MKKTFTGWMERDVETRWKEGYPFKLWQKTDADTTDIKVRITIEQIKRKDKNL
jgi:hypothetical protein